MDKSIFMNLKISITYEDMEVNDDKTICFIDGDRLFLSNIVDIKHVGFFKDLLPEFSEIVYFEHDRPVCPECGADMADNGSRKVKPNKIEGIRKKQYACPDCQKTKVTSLEPFISKFCNYSNDICERGLLYDYIGLLSYEKKGEMIYLEHGVKIPRQTTYYHESIFSEAFLKRQEEMNAKLLEQNGIKPTGYYHYDEQYPRINGEQYVRLALIDAINSLPINELLVHKEDFDKNVVEAFLDSSLENLPKEALITDGAPAYPEIVDKMGMKHQLCVFHIIKNHHTKTFKPIGKVSRRIRTIDKTIPSNKTTIEMIKNEIRNNNLTEDKKKKKRKQIKKLEDENKKLRKERSEKKKTLKELLKTNESVENIYDADTKKSSKRRFNTLNNRKEFLNRHTDAFLVNLDKKFDRTVTYYDDHLIPRTNNNIERYFGITLPSYIKRRYRTIQGLTRWMRIQKIRWIRRNVLHEPTLENISLTQYLQEKNHIIS